MAKNTYTDWDTSASSNTDVGGIGIAEGMSPGLVNDALREVMAQLATASFVDATAIGSTIQAYSGTLTSLSSLYSSASTFVYKNSGGTLTEGTVSLFALGLLDDGNATSARATLGLGTSAVLDVGTGASEVVQLDGSARLPAVDGSQLTNLPDNGIGTGQTATDVSGSRSTATAYQNTTGQPIMVSVTMTVAGNEYFEISTTGAFAGEELIIGEFNGSAFAHTLSWIVQGNEYYQITGGTVQRWVELR